MSRPPHMTRHGRVGVLLTALAALLGLLALGALSPASAQAQSPGAAGATTGSSGGSYGGTTTGTTGDTSVGTSTGTSTGVTGDTSGGTSTGATGDTSTGTTAGTSTAGHTIGGTSGDPGEPTYPAPLEAPAIVSATPTSITLTWPVPADDVPITGYTITWSGGDSSGLLASTPTNTVTITNLRPDDGWEIRVHAKDAAGRASASPKTVITTAELPPTTCSVDYRIVSRWTTGYQAEITIPNTGTTPITDWHLSYDWARDQTVTTMWGGDYSQSSPWPDFTMRGTTVTITPASYTSTIPAGGSVTLGFIATGYDYYSTPYFFTLNGTLCATATP